MVQKNDQINPDIIIMLHEKYVLDYC